VKNHIDGGDDGDDKNCHYCNYQNLVKKVEEQSQNNNYLKNMLYWDEIRVYQHLEPSSDFAPLY